MTPCLSSEEFVDLVDGTLPAARRAHVEACAGCRSTASEVREALALAAEDEVPEPSALFWPSVNARVRAELDALPSAGWRRWLRWETAVPAVAVAALAIAVAVSMGRPAGVPSTSAETPVATAVSPEIPDLAARAAPLVEHDSALALVVDLSQTLPDGGWEILGVTTLPDLADAAQVLSTEEQAALAELLRRAVDRPTS